MKEGDFRPETVRGSRGVRTGTWGLPRKPWSTGKGKGLRKVTGVAGTTVDRESSLVALTGTHNGTLTEHVGRSYPGELTLVSTETCGVLWVLSESFRPSWTPDAGLYRVPEGQRTHGCPETERGQWSEHRQGPLRLSLSNSQTKNVFALRHSSVGGWCREARTTVGG